MIVIITNEQTMSKEEKGKRGLKSFLISIAVAIKGFIIWLITFISSDKFGKTVEGVEEGLHIVKGIQKKAKSGELKQEVDKISEKIVKKIESSI